MTWTEFPDNERWKQQEVKSDLIVLSHWHSKTHSVQAEIHSYILTTLLPLGLDGACTSQTTSLLHYLHLVLAPIFSDESEHA